MIVRIFSGGLKPAGYGLAVTAILAAELIAQQTPVFRATADSVTVNVSVKRGNNVVANLKAADFTLTDNGVPQTIEAFAIENVPIDATLFLDTSASTGGKLAEMTKDVQAIMKMLRAGDRFRLLTIGDSVYPTVPWVDAGTSIDLALAPVGGISLIHDALIFGLLHRPAAGRRHLIVGMTDRADCGSVVPAALLLELAGQTDAVLHLVDYAGAGGGAAYRVRSCTPTASEDGANVITRAAERTGGGLARRTSGFRSTSIVRAFQTIFDEFRQSYILVFTPRGVDARGWHTLGVTVPKIRNATVRARQGYFTR